MPELTVVVPAYHESGNIPALLDGLARVFEGRDWETIVVVDNSQAATGASVRDRAQQDRRVRCIERVGGRGLASGCLEGMLASSAPYIAVLEPGFRPDAQLARQMLDAIRQGEEDLVVASRTVGAGRSGTLAPARLRVSHVASVLGQALAGGVSDPLSGFFVVRRSYLERVARRLYGGGFKVLLDLIAAAEGPVRIRELPMSSPAPGAGKLSVAAVAEFFMLVLYHLFGRWVPARFFVFCGVAVIGIGVHLSVLWSAYAAAGASFAVSQSLAIWGAMTANFFFNNELTYGDEPLRGRGLWRGLLTFYAACSIGALINVAIADWLYLLSVSYWLAGLAGAGIAVVWNFLTTAAVTWGGSRGCEGSAR